MKVSEEKSAHNNAIDPTGNKLSVFFSLIIFPRRLMAIVRPHRRSLMSPFRLSHLLGTMLIGLVASVPALGDDLDQQSRALDLILQFAERFCQAPPTTGSSSAREVSAGAKVELSNLLSKLAGIGLSGAAKYQDSKYQGLLQKDLVEALKNTNECRLKVWSDLQEKLLTSSVSPSQAPPAGTGTTPHSSTPASTQPRLSTSDIAGTYTLIRDSRLTEVRGGITIRPLSATEAACEFQFPLVFPPGVEPPKGAPTYKISKDADELVIYIGGECQLSLIGKKVRIAFDGWSFWWDIEATGQYLIFSLKGDSKDFEQYFRRNE
jgi:hypothetical protein